MAEDQDLDIANLDLEEPENMKRLRDYAERQRVKAQGAGELARENAFLRAGIDLNGRLGKAFAATYDGKLDDVEAIRADAKDFDPRILVLNDGARPDGEQGQGGEGQQGQAQGDGGVQQQDLGSGERNALADGATNTGGEPIDMRKASLARGKELLDSGKSFEVAAGEIVGLRARGAIEGTYQPLPVNGTRPRG